MSEQFIDEDGNSPEVDGACCACGRDDVVLRNILCMSFEGPEGFEGWGCLQCRLPMRGAIAVVCDECLDTNKKPTHICGGKFVTGGERIALEGFERKPFEHMLALHPEVA